MTCGTSWRSTCPRYVPCSIMCNTIVQHVCLQKGAAWHAQSLLSGTASSSSMQSHALSSHIFNASFQAKAGKAKYKLGVQESKLGSAIQDTTGIPCQCNEYIGEVLRGVRMHFT